MNTKPPPSLTALLALTMLCCSHATSVAEPPPASLKTETFDRDPGWEGHNNRIVPTSVVMVKQDFGYSTTNFAGKSSGEMGGRIQRSTTPAVYAAEISPRTLNNKLTASGSFAITASQPGGGVFFGYFRSKQSGGSGRPVGSLGLNMDFEAKGGRLAVRLITDGNLSCGTFVTPYLPGKYRTTPLKADGTRYHWTLDYDPQAAAGNGRFTFTLRSDNHPIEPVDSRLPAASQKEELSRFPHTTTFAVDLPPGHKAENATFDRFGVMNMMKAGGVATIYFDDLQYDGRMQEFAKDPGWVQVGNRVTFEDREQVGAHNFGFSAKTNHAGGSPGEIGGDLWRSGNYGYYADRIGPLTLDQRLEASGKVVMLAGGPDADMQLGWFNGASKDKAPTEVGSFLGVAVGGPTRVGHCFTPSFTTGQGERGRVAKIDEAPLLKPGKRYDWSLIYDPAANQGNGEITVTLGDRKEVLPLKPGRKAEGATFDRFGLFTSQAGGQMVRIYLDDLKYTAAPGPR